MSYSYDVSVRLSKPLTTVSSSLYQLGFCTAGDNTVSPPLLQIAVAGSGTSVANAVQAKCYISNTNSGQTVIAFNPFGTAATATFVFVRENSGNPLAGAQLTDDNNFMPVLKFKAGDTAFFRHTNEGYNYVLSAAASTSSTASLQIIIVGE